ncbi:MAG: FkbM family methyltransferase [Magnetococcales bacterium]|nr:FkbM family methyltransferase [Magnetococcales bacterium]
MINKETFLSFVLPMVNIGINFDDLFKVFVAPHFSGEESSTLEKILQSLCKINASVKENGQVSLQKVSANDHDTDVLNFALQWYQKHAGVSENAGNIFMNYLHYYALFDEKQIIKNNVQGAPVPWYSPDPFADCQQRAFWMNWIVDHRQQLFAAWNQLADQWSKDLFVVLLRYRMSGPSHVRLTTDAHWYWNAFYALNNHIVRNQQYATFSFQGMPIKLHAATSGIFFAFFANQYFYHKENVTIQPESGDHVIDAGAYIGESAVRFSIAVGKEGHVYSFEPVHNHLEIIQHNLQLNNVENVSVMPYGLSNVVNTVMPVRFGSASAIMGQFTIEDCEAPLTTLDTLVANGTIAKVDYIKMDVEGAELLALQGAESTIRRFRPKLVICIYHKPQDLYEIAQWIADLQLGYTFYMDHYMTQINETVLYAAVKPFVHAAV